MSVRTERRDSADWSLLIDRLNDVRLSRDWSYRQLAEDIRRVTRFEVSAQTLQPLLSAAPSERAKPYDRTLHKIRAYLDAVREKPDTKKRRAIA